MSDYQKLKEKYKNLIIEHRRLLNDFFKIGKDNKEKDKKIKLLEKEMIELSCLVNELLRK